MCQYQSTNILRILDPLLKSSVLLSIKFLSKTDICPMTYTIPVWAFILELKFKYIYHLFKTVLHIIYGYNFEISMEQFWKDNDISILGCHIKILIQNVYMHAKKSRNRCILSLGTICIAQPLKRPTTLDKLKMYWRYLYFYERNVRKRTNFNGQVSRNCNYKKAPTKTWINGLAGHQMDISLQVGTSV